MSLEPYEHIALPDPQQYIRLIKILPGSKTDHLSITIEAFERDNAPTYGAISYTWGDKELTKGIIANDKILHITESCWHALGQVRLHSLCKYYWIDAICINQANDTEKSAQVNFMGSTYRNAECGVVAVGRHNSATQYLFRQLQALELPQDHLRDGSFSGYAFEYLNDAAVERLSHGLVVLAMRPYWNRLWIAQEFALPPRVVLCCGNSLVSLDDVVFLIDFLGRKPSKRYAGLLEKLPMKSTIELRSLIRESTSGLAPFGALIYMLGRRECEDPRDRIFGVLSLVEWPEDKKLLSADYSLSEAQLASAVLKIHEGPKAHAADLILKSLKLGPADSGMWKMWESRRAGVPESESSEGLGMRGATTAATEICLRIITHSQIYPLDDQWASVRDLQNPIEAQGPESDATPFELWLATNPWMLPAVTQPGDFIIRLKSTGPNVANLVQSPEYLHGSMLVLRAISSKPQCFSIVGPAFFLKEPMCDITFGTLSGSSLTPHVYYEFNLDEDDLLFWSWQQLYWGRKECSTVQDCDEKMKVMSANFCHSHLSSYAKEWHRPPRVTFSPHDEYI